jgi:hypothetical protein
MQVLRALIETAVSSLLEQVGDFYLESSSQLAESGRARVLLAVFELAHGDLGETSLFAQLALRKTGASTNVAKTRNENHDANYIRTTCTSHIVVI